MEQTQVQVEVQDIINSLEGQLAQSRKEFTLAQAANAALCRKVEALTTELADLKAPKSEDKA